MRVSNFFLPVLKEDPSEAEIISHKLMLRAGLIKQISSGIYAWLPLGIRVLNKISSIIRNVLDSYSMIEVLAPCVQSADLWNESGRINDYGKEMLKFQDRHNNTLIFGPTAEEVVTEIFKTNIRSYKDLPKILYNIQWKFRDEIRPRFGVMRAREFLMKDAYSFDISPESHEELYRMVFESYMKIFKNLGLRVVPVVADNGVIGGNLSHEFHILAETGESTIYFDEDLLGHNISFAKMANLYSVAEEKHDSSKLPEKKLKHIKSSKSIEVGHIFSFGTKYSIPMNCFVKNNAGNLVPLEMGSYGIGVTRLIGAIIESNHDKNGIIWPSSIAPFHFSLINLHNKDQESCELADFIYHELTRKHIEVLYDDTGESPGAKFATHDLIGIPVKIIVSKHTAKERLIEIKKRDEAKPESTQIMNVEAFFKKFL